MKDTIHAWKDSTYRQSLPTEAQTTLRSNSTSNIELTDAELETIYGGGGMVGNLLGTVTSLAGQLPVVGDVVKTASPALGGLQLLGL